MKAKIYDKSREITEESTDKTYEEEWNDFNGKKIYRIEITILWEQFKTWLQYVNSSKSPFLFEWKQFISEEEGEEFSSSENFKDYLARTQYLLLLEEYRYALWQFCSKRILYFRHRKTNEVITLLDIATGWKPQ